MSALSPLSASKRTLTNRDRPSAAPVRQSGSTRSHPTEVDKRRPAGNGFTRALTNASATSRIDQAGAGRGAGPSDPGPRASTPHCDRVGSPARDRAYKRLLRENFAAVWYDGIARAYERST
jgi:hypothetical protein